MRANLLIWFVNLADNRGPDRRRSGPHPERISSCYIKALRSSELGSRFGAYSQFIPAEVWKSEVCSGIDPGLAARVLAERGMLVRAEDGFIRVHKIEGRTQRAYTVTAAILDGGM